MTLLLPAPLILLSPGDLNSAGLPPFERALDRLGQAAESVFKGPAPLALLWREFSIEDRWLVDCWQRCRGRLPGLGFGLHDRAHLLVPGLLFDPGAAGAGAVPPFLHLARRSLEPAAVRPLLSPGIALGYSSHRERPLPGAEWLDYLFLSPIGSVPGKDEPLGAAGFAALCQHTALPTWALGGVTPELGPALLAAGARGFVIQRSWLAASDSVSNLERLLADFAPLLETLLSQNRRQLSEGGRLGLE